MLILLQAHPIEIGDAEIRNPEPVLLLRRHVLVLLFAHPRSPRGIPNPTRKPKPLVIGHWPAKFEL